MLDPENYLPQTILSLVNCHKYMWSTVLVDVLKNNQGKTISFLCSKIGGFQVYLFYCFFLSL